MARPKKRVEVDGRRTPSGEIVTAALDTLVAEFGPGAGAVAFANAVARTLSVQLCIDLSKQCEIEATFVREIQAHG